MKDERFICHPFLQKVADEDVRYLIAKDRVYGGSWKRGKGRSAYFMLCRKMHRLEEMMKRNDPPKNFNLDNLDKHGIEYLKESYLAEDIFERIKYEELKSGGRGSEESILDQVRDLRRYLCLVESDLMAQGFIEEPIKSGTPEDGGHHSRYEEIDES